MSVAKRKKIPIYPAALEPVVIILETVNLNMSKMFLPHLLKVLETDRASIKEYF